MKLAVANEQVPVSRRAIRKRILVVDDDSFVLRSQRRHLSKYFQVETASGPELAAIKLAQNEYFAIVTDFDMPHYDGIWLLMQVAARFPNMKRVLISANDPVLFAPHVESGLIQSYLAKPMAPARLIDYLHR